MKLQIKNYEGTLFSLRGAPAARHFSSFPSFGAPAARHFFFFFSFSFGAPAARRFFFLFFLWRACGAPFPPFVPLLEYQKKSCKKTCAKKKLCTKHVFAKKISWSVVGGGASPNPDHLDSILRYYLDRPPPHLSTHSVIERPGGK